MKVLGEDLNEVGLVALNNLLQVHVRCHAVEFGDCRWPGDPSPQVLVQGLGHISFLAWNDGKAQHIDAHPGAISRIAEVRNIANFDLCFQHHADRYQINCTDFAYLLVERQGKNKRAAEYFWADAVVRTKISIKR